jgi:hypothetical protein
LISRASLFATAAAALTGCASLKTPPPPPIDVINNSLSQAPEKTRLFVIETFPLSFGANGRLFQDGFADLARSCRVGIEFFPIPPEEEKLSLDPGAETVAARAELARRLTAFGPDGILEVRTTGWQAKGDFSQNGKGPQSNATFYITLHLTDGAKRTDLGSASLSLKVKSGTGGELLPAVAEQLLRAAGALRHCPN